MREHPASNEVVMLEHFEVVHPAVVVDLLDALDRQVEHVLPNPALEAIGVLTQDVCVDRLEDGRAPAQRGDATGAGRRIALLV